MDIMLPESVEYILHTLEEAGYRADIVGGSVRDILLGKAPDDYDITTDASPQQTKSVFSHVRTVDTGIKHGTVSLIIEGKQYEITTYRLDGEYKDSRHPDTVTFTRDIEDDLARRDFTVNAIAYNPRHGLTDPYGGIADLRRGVIRAVGDSDKRFREDALRILRAVRFSAVLGFEIEEETARAAVQNRALLDNVSPERIYTELRKLISGEFAFSVLERYSPIILQAIPELSAVVLPDRGRFAAADYTARFLSLFYLSGSDFPAACRRLHTENHIRQLGQSVISSVGKYQLGDEIGLTYLLHDLGAEAAEELVRLEILLGRAGGENLSLLRALIDSGAVYSLSGLALSGSDILSLGVCGREVGDILGRLLSEVIERKVVNSKENLQKRAKELVKNK